MVNWYMITERGLHMDIKGGFSVHVSLKAIEYDLHGRTVHLIPVEKMDSVEELLKGRSRTPCADCGQQAVWNVIENAEDEGEEEGTHGWLWCGVSHH
jgi:hypothetical protein